MNKSIISLQTLNFFLNFKIFKETKISSFCKYQRVINSDFKKNYTFLCCLLNFNFIVPSNHDCNCLYKKLYSVIWFFNFFCSAIFKILLNIEKHIDQNVFMKTMIYQLMIHYKILFVQNYISLIHMKRIN